MPESQDPQLLLRRSLEASSHDLARAVNSAVTRQANRWGIRFDQAQALLLDRKAVA